MEIGNTVKLIGKTRHGKNRVREQGEQWEVLFITRPACCNNELSAFLSSGDNRRWVMLDNDPNTE